MGTVEAFVPSPKDLWLLDHASSTIQHTFLFVVLIGDYLTWLEKAVGPLGSLRALMTRPQRIPFRAAVSATFIL